MGEESQGRVGRPGGAFDLASARDAASGHKKASKESNKETDEGKNVWRRPMHMVIGGWEAETDRDTIEAERERMLQRIPQAADDCQGGCAPRTDRGTAKVKNLQGQLGKMVHMTKQWLEERGGVMDGKTRWATIEQSPEHGRRNDIDDVAAIRFSKKGIARHDVATN